MHSPNMLPTIVHHQVFCFYIKISVPSSCKIKTKHCIIFPFYFQDLKEIPAYIIQQGSEIEELDLTNNKISYPLILY
jgi:hypothetical protein